MPNAGRQSMDEVTGEHGLPEEGTHVVLGTGQIGHAVADYLSACEAEVRVVNRSGEAPADLRNRVTSVGADVVDPVAARDACEGASVVYFCLQPPYGRWADLFPPLLDGAIEGAAAADARFVMADNLYMYAQIEGPIHEDVPVGPQSDKGRVRAALARSVLDAHDDGRIRATIGRASDFYGPGVTASIAGDRLFPQVSEGGTVWYPGDPDQPHTYTYVRDFARALVTLGVHESALGTVWHVPSADTLTTREFVALAGEVAGTDPTVRGVPSWLLGVLGYVVPTLGQLTETGYQRTEPFVVSSEQFEENFDVEPTPHREALAATVEWYRSRD